MKNIRFVILLIIICLKNLDLLTAQTSTLGHLGTIGDYLGWNNITAQALEIRQDNITTPYSIEFWTNATKQMEIDGATGNVGMGASPVSTQKLNVNNDINLSTSALNHGYHIGGSLLLSSPGTENLLLGFNSGLNLIISGSFPAVGNTLSGSNAGQAITQGSNNSFFGNHAGYSNINDNNTFSGAFSGYTNRAGTYNTFAGMNSGYNNYDGNQNTFIGYNSGFSNTSASDNVFVGMNSGKLNTTGYDGTFIGNFAGYTNSTGMDNTFLGYKSGYTNNGSLNTFVVQEVGNLTLLEASILSQVMEVGNQILPAFLILFLVNNQAMARIQDQETLI